MPPKKPFTTEMVSDLLIGYGYLEPGKLQEIVQRSPLIRRRIEREQEAQGHRTEVLPPEIIAGMNFPSALDPARTINEDLIYELLARAEGMRYVKIDPLKLDAKVVTGFLSRPFARKHLAVPLEERGPDLFVAVANPFDAELLENLPRVTGKRVVPVLSAKADILRIITEIFGFRKSVSAAEASIEAGVDLGNLEQLFKLQNVDQIEENDRHIVNAVDYILHYAIEQRASDIHIEPKREVSQIRLRIDGVLHNVYSMPKKVHPPFISRLKAMSRLDIAERRRPQDGRMKMAANEREIEIRMSTVPTAFGEKVVLRIFDSGLLLKEPDLLGFEREDLERFQRLARQSTGLILVTGPTGSGKTTTLYSTLKMLAGSAVNITTVEDPIEMVVDDFNQIAVQRRIDLGFASALKHILRQDPDIIMVGEIRDSETAENAVQAALTGHLVLSSVHTNDSVTAVARLVELGVKPYLISSTLTMVVAQRLARMICPVCKQETSLSDEEMESLGLKAPGQEKRLKAWEGAGCPQCRHTGLYGRTGIFEVLEVTDRIRGLVKQQADARELMRTARQDGMATLKESGVKKLARGLTSYDELMRVLTY